MMNPHWGAHGMNRRRSLLKWFIEGRVTLQRVATYANTATFLLVAGLWADKAYDAFFSEAVSFAWFMTAAVLAAGLLFVIVGVIDRRLVWPKEGSVMAGVVPIARSEALRSAYFLATYGDEEGIQRARPWFEEAGLGTEFDAWVGYWKSHTRDYESLIQRGQETRKHEPTKNVRAPE